jgi:hypothetical protein
MLYDMANFLLSVAAGIIANYVCKWLDEHSRKGR